MSAGNNPQCSERLIPATMAERALPELQAELSPALVAPAVLTFTQVFQQFAGYVLGLLRRLGVSAEDVEDVAQEVFIAIHVHLPRFEGRSSLKSWVCGICLRRAADYRRKQHRRRQASRSLPDAPEPSPLADVQLERSRLVERLERALGELPEKQLQVFVLYEIEQLPMHEVARAVGCPRFTAYTRLRAARQALQGYFSQPPAPAEPSTRRPR